MKEREITIASTLKTIEGRLKGHHFQRVHRHHLVNLHCVAKYEKGRGGRLALTNGTSVLVAARRRKKLMEALKEE